MTVNTPSKEESNFKNGVDELAITMIELANSMAESPKEKTRVYGQIQPIPLKYLEEKKTPRATSFTQLEIKIKQPPQKKGMSIKELVAKLINRGRTWLKCPVKDNIIIFHPFLK